VLLSGFVCYQFANIARAKGLQAVTEELELKQIQTSVEDSASEESDVKLKIAGVINQFNSSLNKDQLFQFSNTIYRQSKKYNYDWELILAIIKTESDFNARAKSVKGARGLMQVLPSTAKWLSPKMGLRYRGRDSLYDASYNIKLGTHYLNMMHRKFGDMEKAIVAYNAGPTRLVHYLRKDRKYSSCYLSEVMGCYRDLKSPSDKIAS